MYLRRVVPSTSILVVLLMILWPVLLAAQDSATDSGNVTVEIVPPGSEPKSPPGAGPQSPQPSQSSESVQPSSGAPGTLSATLMWLPDPAQGQSRMHGMIAVQDHRARADGWTVRLQSDPAQTVYVVDVVVGQTGFGIPDWLYQGIHVWDVAMGAPLQEAPQIVTAPKPHGYSLTIHQLWIEVDPEALGQANARVTLVLMLPAAP